MTEQLLAQSRDVERQLQASRQLAEDQHRWDQEEHEREHQQLRSSVRLLLCSERDYNLNALRTYWKDYVEKSVVAVGEEQQFVQRLRFTTKPLPFWEHHRWQSLTTELTQALAPEELQSLQAIHTDLDTLTVLRERFVPLMSVNVDKYERYRKTTPATTSNLPTDLFEAIRDYLAESNSLWLECWSLWRTLDTAPAFTP